jgi:hypothetical protein
MESTAPLMVTSAAPLAPVMVVGLTVQVVVPRDAGTLQVSATSELNPPTGATVRLSVMGVPLGTETTKLATVRVKSAATVLTVTGICKVWLSVPLAAATVTEPVVADEDAATVSVVFTAADVLAVTGVGLNEQVSPDVALQEKFTLPENPCTEVTLMVSVVVLPLLTVSTAFPDESWKSGTVTVTSMTTAFVLAPLVPCTVTVPVCAPCDEAS